MNEVATELIKARMSRTGESAEVAAVAIASKCLPESRASLVDAAIEISRFNESAKP